MKKGVMDGQQGENTSAIILLCFFIQVVFLYVYICALTTNPMVCLFVCVVSFPFTFLCVRMCLLSCHGRSLRKTVLLLNALERKRKNIRYYALDLMLDELTKVTVFSFLVVDHQPIQQGKKGTQGIQKRGGGRDGRTSFDAIQEQYSFFVSHGPQNHFLFLFYFILKMKGSAHFP
jgi:hypothetical protein